MKIISSSHTFLSDGHILSLFLLARYCADIMLPHFVCIFPCLFAFLLCLSLCLSLASYICLLLGPSIIRSIPPPPYFSLSQVASSLQLPITVLSKVTASVFFRPDDWDLGLRLKNTKQMLVLPGYSKMITRTSSQSQVCTPLCPSSLSRSVLVIPFRFLLCVLPV